mmetsp:Transcript_49198/g.123686  ORF Transcript_49198/g.123686 Transcript_49198/m.123686 type:complete len:86 (-) Transcript_49198:31-288(-)
MSSFFKAHPEVVPNLAAERNFWKFQRMYPDQRLWLADGFMQYSTQYPVKHPRAPNYLGKGRHYVIGVGACLGIAILLTVANAPRD